MSMMMESEVLEVDREAMARAIDIMLGHHERIYRTDFKRRLEGAMEPWANIGRHAASACQCQALGLKPWQQAPCDVQFGEIDAPAFEHRRIAAAAAILARLLTAGLSRYEPDPVNALTLAERGGHKR
jgi:hypothetical protein